MYCSLDIMRLLRRIRHAILHKFVLNFTYVVFVTQFYVFLYSNLRRIRHSTQNLFCIECFDESLSLYM
jgi:hypothetical protein